MQAKLTGREEQALAVKPTNNPEAYDAYLRGLAFDGRSSITSYSIPSPQLKAVGSFERAVQLDPNFALAWARISRADSALYIGGATTLGAMQRNVLWRMRRNWSQTRLKPCSPWVGINTWCFAISEAAKTTFKRVSKMFPGNSQVPAALGLIAREEGHWDESLAYYEQCLTLDPRNVDSSLHHGMDARHASTIPARAKTL